MKQDNRAGYEALRSGAAIIRRTDLGRLLITGADRRAYLQGLLTNDIAALTAGTGCYAAMLTAQGRMITDMHVHELGDAVLVVLPVALAGPVQEHLERFVFSEDVQVADVTSARAQVGLYGPMSDESAFRPDPGDHGLLLKVEEFKGVDFIVESASAGELESTLARAGAVTATLDDLEVVRIERGIPKFGVDMDTDTIPLEAGIEDRAVSRTKGCYVGQEVIVRVIDRGHGRVARHLVRLVFSPDAAVPARDAAIHAGEREIGRVTSGVFSPALGHPIALGYVHRDFMAPGTSVDVVDAVALVTAIPSRS